MCFYMYVYIHVKTRQAVFRRKFINRRYMLKYIGYSNILYVTSGQLSVYMCTYVYTHVYILGCLDDTEYCDIAYVFQVCCTCVCFPSGSRLRCVHIYKYVYIYIHMHRSVNMNI